MIHVASAEILTSKQVANKATSAACLYPPLLLHVPDLDVTGVSTSEELQPLLEPAHDDAGATWRGDVVADRLPGEQEVVWGKVQRTGRKFAPRCKAKARAAQNHEGNFCAVAMMLWFRRWSLVAIAGSLSKPINGKVAHLRLLSYAFCDWTADALWQITRRRQNWVLKMRLVLATSSSERSRSRTWWRTYMPRGEKLWSAAIFWIEVLPNADAAVVFTKDERIGEQRKIKQLQKLTTAKKRFWLFTNKLFHFVCCIFRLSAAKYRRVFEEPTRHTVLS